MELWDLYNEKRERMGQTHVRGEAIPSGLYHLVVHVWIRNAKGEYLISQRSADRPTFPLMWECVGGSALAGEDSLAAALRETKEEVGIELDRARGMLAHSVIRKEINGKRFADILDVWVFEYDGDADLDAATTREVAQTQWMSRTEIQNLLDQGDFVHTLGYFFTEIEGNITLELLSDRNIEQARAIQRNDIGEAFVDGVDAMMELTQYGIDHHCKGHTYLIRQEGICIGLILLGEAFEWATDPEEMKGVPFYRLMGFVIDRRYRSGGIGGYILERVIELIYNEFGIRPIALGVHKDNIGAERFYRNHGFRKTGVMEGNDYYYLRYPNENTI